MELIVTVSDAALVGLAAQAALKGLAGPADVIEEIAEAWGVRAAMNVDPPHKRFEELDVRMDNAVRLLVIQGDNLAKVEQDITALKAKTSSTPTP